MSEAERMELVNAAELSSDEMKLLNVLADLAVNVVSANAEVCAMRVSVISNYTCVLCSMDF